MCGGCRFIYGSDIMAIFTKFQRSHYQGFSLLEMAVVVSILGVLLSGVLTVATSSYEKKSVANSKADMSYIKSFIDNYYQKYGYIPCPASPTAVEGTSGFGVATDCSSAVISPANTWEIGSSTDTLRGGVLPIRTLGLPDSSMYDEWGNRLGYVAIKALAVDDVTYQAYVTALTTGVIQIVDVNYNQILDASTNSIVSYVLISYGKDRKGAFGRKILDSNPKIACGSVTKDSENCDNNDNVFIDSVIKDSVNSNHYFYDLVEWGTWNSKDAVDRTEEYFTVIAVSTKEEMSCALDGSGYAWCWGQIYGVASQLLPFQIDAVNSFKAIEAGKLFFCGITTSDGLMCMGDGGKGQLGNGSGSSSATLVAVTGGFTWKSLDAGEEFACAIRSNDSLWCWGEGGDLQLGNGSTSDRNSPVAVSGGALWKSVTAGRRHACGIKMDNSAWCWGEGGDGQLGNGSTSDRNTPIAVSGGASWSQLAAGEKSTCGIKLDGSAWCWGDNGDGQLGRGNSSDSTAPVAVSGGHVWQSIHSGDRHACAIRTDNVGYCWGNNGDGQVGDGSTSDQNAPIAISSGHTWTKIDGGNDHSCGVDSDSHLLCWGTNGNGQVGDGTTTSSSIPVNVDDVMP